MIMDKKLYIEPSLKAHNMDEELLAAMSGGGDVNIPGSNTPTGEAEEGDGSDAAARKNYSVWDE